MSKNKEGISRKEFLKQSITAGIGIGLLGKTLKSAESPYRVLGRTGIKVVPVGFGASRTMEPALVRSAIDKGMNFIDTGRSYFNGQNEVMLGKCLRGIRKGLVIQSKMKVHLKEKDLKSAEASQKIKRMMGISLAESLEALRTDYIDVMLIHGAWSRDTIHHDTVMEFFEKIKKEGKIRAYGFSSHNNQVELLKAANQIKFHDVIMVPYTHAGTYAQAKSDRSREWDQQKLEEELAKAKKNEIAIVAMKTCSGGPYSPKKGIKPSYEEAIRWVLKNSAISTTAVAMASFGQIKEDIRALTVA